MVFISDSSVLSHIFLMVFFPDSSKSNLLCCCNRFHVLSQIFQMVFFPDSSESNLLCCCNRFPVFSQIFQMGFFSRLFCVTLCAQIFQMVFILDIPMVFLTDSSVLSQIFQMVFFPDSSVLSQIFQTLLKVTYYAAVTGL